MHIKQISKTRPAQAQSIEVMLDIYAQLLGVLNATMGAVGNVGEFKEDKEPASDS